MYQQLDPAQILRTMERLRGRIEERFPDASLGRVCRALIDAAQFTQAGSAAARSERSTGCDRSRT
jgi:hypothetical protein